jgi:hypothetical protein
VDSATISRMISSWAAEACVVRMSSITTVHAAR